MSASTPALGDHSVEAKACVKNIQADIAANTEDCTNKMCLAWAGATDAKKSITLFFSWISVLISELA